MGRGKEAGLQPLFEKSLPLNPANNSSSEGKWGRARAGETDRRSDRASDDLNECLWHEAACYQALNSTQSEISCSGIWNQFQSTLGLSIQHSVLGRLCCSYAR